MSTPEIITVNSEALEAQIRDLLPSQRGFGSELQASNVIMPTIDLTATAEGSGLDVSLQQAMAFGSQTSFSVSNATSTIVTATGFTRIFGLINNFVNTTATITGDINITDGSSSKKILSIISDAVDDKKSNATPFDFIVFCRAGDTVTCRTDNSKLEITGTVRQLATITGELVNPSGFVAE
tara:strand:+ start:376 stop:918 length:543 start_codon:yes stop_codon:yes gene_type:complete